MASNDFPLSEGDKLLERLRSQLELSAGRLGRIGQRKGLTDRNIQRTVEEAPLIQEGKIRDLQDLANRALQRAERLGTRRREDRLSKERKDRAITAFEVLQRGSLGRKELDLMQQRIQNALKLGKRELDIKELLGQGELDTRRRRVREEEKQGKFTRGMEREARDLVKDMLNREDSSEEALQNFLRGSGNTGSTPFSREIIEGLGLGRR